MSKRPSSRRRLPLACYAASLFLTPPLCSGTKHSFITRNDGRSFIGLGAPFGFQPGGNYNLTVFDFELSVDKKGKRRSADGRTALRYVEAGFLLKRFDSESHYHQAVAERPAGGTVCAFESYRGLDDAAGPASALDDLLGADDDGLDVKYDDDEGGGHRPSAAGTDGIFLSMNQPERSWKPHVASISYTFDKPEDEGLYFLIFQICPRGDVDGVGIGVRASFAADLHFKNYDTFGRPSYLTAGEMWLPEMYLYFSMSYALCFGLWASNVRNIRLGRNPIWAPPGGRSLSRPSVHAIHHLMTLLLGLKTATVFFEAARYYHIKIHGHAEFLSAVYLFMSFVKGMFMFTVILLIGSGWSLVKPALGDREKMVIWLVLVLQVIDNVAVVVLSRETEGEKLYEDWSALLHLVDILCCCAVLIPIVWQVNSLETVMQADTEKSASGIDDPSDAPHEPKGITDVESEAPASADAGRTLRKLKQFRHFYILVVGYIYFTRIAVYLFATMLGYRQTWLRYFVTELGTLVFYAVVGFLFRPEDDNPYFEVKEGDAASREIEFSSTPPA